MDAIIRSKYPDGNSPPFTSFPLYPFARLIHTSLTWKTSYTSVHLRHVTPFSENLRKRVRVRRCAREQARAHARV